MMTILNTIVEQKRLEVTKAQKDRPLAMLQEMPVYPKRDFIAHLNQAPLAIIAEIKKASPSQGIIRPDFHVESIAKAYEQNGASALSVLTDESFFQGHLENIRRAKSASELPVLRKDFIIDAYQIEESKAYGADCILLIVAILDDVMLRDYSQMAEALGLAVLIESHTQAELERALRLPTPLIGINNRNLHDFKIDLKTTLDLIPLIPSSRRIITESGIQTHDDILMMQSHGVNTFLIGEQCMRAPDVGLALRALMSCDNEMS